MTTDQPTAGRRRSLGRVMAVQLALLVICAMAIGLVGLWAVSQLTGDIRTGRQLNQSMRDLYEGVGLPLADARMQLRQTDAVVTSADAIDRAEYSLNRASQNLGRLSEDLRLGLAMSMENHAGIEPLDGEVHLEELAAALELARQSLADGQPAVQQVARINAALNHVRQLAESIALHVQSVVDHGEMQRRWTWIMLSSLVAVVGLLAVYMGVRQYRMVMRPLRRLLAATQKIGAGQFDQRLPDEPYQQFHQLSRGFNRMAEALQRLYQQMDNESQKVGRELVRSERLASVGFLAAGVAHEINNPLGVILGHSELAARQPQDASTAESLEIIREQTMRCKEITEQLLSLARPEDGPMRAVRLTELLEQMRVMAQAIGPIRDQQITLNIEVPDDAPDTLAVRGHAAQLKQVLLNLMLNACDAIVQRHGDSGGRLTLALDPQIGTIHLCVIDNGVGLSRQMLEQVFEPFFTRRQVDPLHEQPPTSSRRGVGLGLTICQAIVSRHDGRIWAQSDGANTGCCMVVALPAYDGVDDNESTNRNRSGQAASRIDR